MKNLLAFVFYRKIKYPKAVLFYGDGLFVLAEAYSACILVSLCYSEKSRKKADSNDKGN